MVRTTAESVQAEHAGTPQPQYMQVWCSLRLLQQLLPVGIANLCHRPPDTLTHERQTLRSGACAVCHCRCCCWHIRRRSLLAQECCKAAACQCMPACQLSCCVCMCISRTHIRICLMAPNLPNSSYICMCEATQGTPLPCSRGQVTEVMQAGRCLDRIEGYRRGTLHAANALYSANSMNRPPCRSSTASVAHGVVQKHHKC